MYDQACSTDPTPELVRFRERERCFIQQDKSRLNIFEHTVNLLYNV